MNALRQNKAACAYPAMLLNGVCASSGGVVVSNLTSGYYNTYFVGGIRI